ncbi:MAG: LolA family protein [Hyphomicrobium sp.]
MRLKTRIAAALACAGLLSLTAVAVSAPAMAQAVPAPAQAPASAAPPPAAAPAASPATGAEAVGGGGWNAEVAPSGRTCLTLDDKQVEVVKQVTAYFGGLTTLQGRFVQTTSDQKRMKGKFSVKRPGRFRFDYSLPSKQVIISDGEYLAIQDLDLNNEDRISLDQTPFRLLLRKDVDLGRDACIVEVLEADDRIVVGLRDKSPDTPGRIRLSLTRGASLELKEWITTDAQGVATQVEVGELALGAQIDDGQFKINPVGLMKTTP